MARRADVIESVLAALRSEGFTLVGTASTATTKEDAAAYRSFLDADHDGPLKYLRRSHDARLDPRALIPWVRGAFCAAIPYNTSREVSADYIASGKAWVSRYAWGRDYHKVVRKKLKAAASLLLEAGFQARVCCDSFPLLERALARRAGLGFIGKNGLLIHPEYGSYLFLGEILTDLELPPGHEVPDGCGGCSKCIKACPVKAFAAPRILDAGKCISTWTIEHRGPFPPEAPPLHGHLFGCDRCQEVCPYNSKAPLSIEPDFAPRLEWFAPPPSALLKLSDAELESRLIGSPLRRTGAEGLRRNAAKVIENSISLGSSHA
jgi:epoxyqueuosine reductase